MSDVMYREPLPRPGLLEDIGKVVFERHVRQ
jgi:hypothetical protein